MNERKHGGMRGEPVKCYSRRGMDGWRSVGGLRSARGEQCGSAADKRTRGMSWREDGEGLVSDVKVFGE